MNNEEQIIRSWHTNAGNWIRIIESNGIESRRVITNKAIVEEVCRSGATTVLDIGCGEGWLAQQLTLCGMSLTGVDVIPELVTKARERSTGHFIIASYEDIYEQRVELPGFFNAIVINFALIGKESTEKLLAALPAYLAAGGQLFIQTLHPHSRKQIDDYSSGWKQGSWDGLGEEFTQSYEWYFRTLEDWIQLLHDTGYANIIIHEIMHPESNAPLSVIFRATAKPNSKLS